MARRNFWGWGVEGGGLGADQVESLRGLMAARLDAPAPQSIVPPKLEDIHLAAPRVSPPAGMGCEVSREAFERAGHTYGKAFRDVARALAGDFSPAPDLVAFPANETEIQEVLAWCAAAKLAAIPYGGGSSVVGGVEARIGAKWNGAVSIDLRKMAAVAEIDPVSRAARIQAGIYGPALEEGLKPYGFTLRHFPQSFEFSTLGGWVATRAGGHYATLYTHIDDFVESMRVVTPSGIIASRRLPGSGAGPDPNRLFIGSEGALGIITEAWMRLQARPRYRAAATVRFDDFFRAAGAARLLAQSGLFPTNCRLLDANEALNNGAGDGSVHLLLIAFESHDHPLDAWMGRALEIARSCGGAVREGAGRTVESGEGERDGEAGVWRTMFLQGPYLRDALATLGLVVETFETAVTWDRFEAFHRGILSAVGDAAKRVCGVGFVSCRLTHVYPDGAAPYYTVIAPSKPGSQMAQWDEIKAAASEALLRFGGTITHHHAVGRDHRPWYEQERPALFGDALRAAKKVLDPGGILNPGVLLAE